MIRTLLCATSCALALLAVPAPADDDKDPVAREAAPLPRAHAHNDYAHARPLLDALEEGFCSVEADIFLEGDDLLVGHDRDELREGRTLERLYIAPLRERVRANAGRVHRDGPPFTLLIDIKSDGEKTYEALHVLLGRHREMLARWEDDKATPGAVTVIISGNRPRELITEQKLRYAAVDGRLGDLESEPDVALVPLISDNWRNHFRWRGEGDLPAEEREKLRTIVKKTHEQGRRLRFWATPDRVAVWKELHDAGVDLINTDDLAGLRKYLSTVDRR